MIPKYSLIIIGAGMTGLSAGLAWALNHDPERAPVLILEKEPQTGGFVTTYTRRGYAFDTCQMISDCTPLFDYFGLGIELKTYTGSLCRVFVADPSSGENRVIDLPSGRERFEDHLRRSMPGAAGAIRAFMRHTRAMYDEMRYLKTVPSLIDLIMIALRCPRTVRAVSKTFQAFLETFGVSHPDFREILRVFVMMAGLPESQVAAFLPVGVMCSLLDGAMRPAGAFGELPRRMTERFRELGGVLKLRSAVEQILVRDGRVFGVRLENGETLTADRVISAVDTRQAMDRLIGREVLRAHDPAYAEKAAQVPMTASTINVLLGLDPAWQPELEEGYHVLTTGGDTVERLFQSFEQGQDGYSETCFHFSVTYSLAVPDKPTLTISLFPMASGDWAAWRAHDKARYAREKERWAAYAIAMVGRYLLPGLLEHIRVQDVSTPATYARYSGAAGGAIYDMASPPGNFGLKRLRMQTPIKGLLHPKFAHGIFGSMNSGLQAVDLLMHGKLLGGNSRCDGHLKPPQRKREGQ